MTERHVLVIGAPPAGTAIVRSLARRGISAWSDTIPSAIDPVTLAWADALVVVPEDSGAALDTGELPPAGFPGPVVLAASSPPAGDLVAALLERGYDAVLYWPSHPEVIAAYVARLLDPCAPGTTPCAETRRIALQGRRRLPRIRVPAVRRHLRARPR